MHGVGKRSACKVLVGKHEGKGSLGRTRHRWEDLEEIGGGVNASSGSGRN
jgi:hypothetical protein